MYLRTTPKLSNKNTKVIKMECPYLLIDPGRRICRQMTAQSLDGELDDFDVAHYCKGNPNHCFFFRFYNNRIQVTAQPEGNEPDVPIIPLAPIVLTKPIQPDEPSSKHSDKLLKLKRFLRLKS